MRDFDEVRVVGRVLLRSDVAINFVPSRMPHRGDFIDFAAVFPFADRRMIVCEFPDLARFQQVKAGVAHLSDGNFPAFKDRRPSGHTPCRASPHSLSSKAENFIICNRDRFPNALGRGSGRTFESGA